MKIRLQSQSNHSGTGNASPHPADPALDEGLSAQQQDIAQAAYFRAEQRGFAPGSELDDWLKAEASLRDTPVSPSTRAARAASATRPA